MDDKENLAAGGVAFFAMTLVSGGILLATAALAAWIASEVWRSFEVPGGHHWTLMLVLLLSVGTYAGRKLTHAAYSSEERARRLLPRRDRFTR